MEKFAPQYTHAIDMVPTVLDLLDIEPPTSIKGVTQSPIEGVSFAHSFDEASVETKRHTQYFEMMGHRSIYHDGWRAVCPWPGPSFTEAGAFFGEPIPAEKLTELDAQHWELYHVDEDFAENHNIAAQNRAKLIEMIGQWYVEAGKFNVMPVDGRGTARFAEERPQIAKDRTSYTFYPNTQSVPFNAGPRLLNTNTHNHSRRGDSLRRRGRCPGLLWRHRWRLFILHQGRKIAVCAELCRPDYLQVESTKPVPAGHHKLRFEFEVTGPPDIANGKGSPGHAQLYIDNQLVGQARVPPHHPAQPGIDRRHQRRCGSRRPGRPLLRDPFRVHRNDLQRDLRCQR